MAITRLTILALPLASASVIYGLLDVLSAVGRDAMVRSAARFEVELVALHRARFRCHGGIPVEPHRSIDEVDETDVILIPDLTLDPERDPRQDWREVAGWLRQRHEAATVLCSVCTGSLLLAASGLLDDKLATTHWAASGWFAQYFPKVRLASERTLVAADASETLVTAGGGATWEELALYLIRRYCGQMAAIRAAKYFLLGDRSHGQLPYASAFLPRRHADSVVAACQRWIAEHHAVSNPVSQMVRYSGLPERTFKRRFQRATGYAPVNYVQALRIDLAKSQLETGDASTESVAESVGYEDPATFRRLFKRYVGVSPAQYRRQFRATGKLDLHILGQ